MKKSVHSSVVNSQSQGSIVHVFIRHEGEIHSFTYSSTVSPLDIIDSIKSTLHLTGVYSVVVPNIPFKIVDSMEGSEVKETGFYKSCIEYGIIPAFELIERSQAEKYESVGILAKLMNQLKENYQIIGQTYVDVLNTDAEEIFVFRRSLARTRVLSSKIEAKYDSNLKEENEFAYTLSEPNIPDTIKSIDVEIIGEDYKTTAIFSITPQVFVHRVIDSAFHELKKAGEGAVNGKEPSEYILKVVGWDEYIVPQRVNGKNWLLSDYDYIRRCALHGEAVHLELVKKSRLFSCKINDEERKVLNYLDSFFASELWEAFDDEKRVSQRLCTDQLSAQVVSVENLYSYIKTKKGDEEEQQMITDFLCYFKVELYYGEKSLCPALYSTVFEVKNGLASPKWKFTFVQLIATLPAETKMIYSVYMTNSIVNTQIEKIGENDKCLGTVNTKIVNYTNDLLNGEQQYYLWASEPNPIAMCCNAVSSKMKVVVEFPSLTKPIRMDTYITKKKEMQVELEQESEKKMTAEELEAFKKIVDADAMAVFTQEELKCLWERRYSLLKTNPHALARLLNSVNYCQPTEVHELHRLLSKWPLLDPREAIELLDFRYPDPQIRGFALRCIDTMTDDQLVMYLPQLVQALKFELHHHSTLASFLLERSLKNRRRIGHNLFWFLKAEIHDARVTGRYGVLMEAFLNGCGRYKNELEKEVTFQNQLVVIANEVKRLGTKDEQKAHLKSSLAKLEYPDEMSLPLDARFRFKKPVPNTGNVFSSKKKPLMLVLENADPLGEPIMVIQKVGDDLRQDILTLQMIRLMNTIWKNNGLDLCMLPYLCIATGNEIGMLELVKNSETYGAIMAMDKSKFSVIKDTAVTTWLKEQCARPESQVTFQEAVENFTYSCAGYCVATYILGIGDRHSDNVMISRDGKFFHIDFGHFLGNFKSKFGVKRERTPFKFTQHFANVLGGKGSPQFVKFEEICMNAFVIIRKHGPLFIYLFRLMLATGIPELQSAKDIEYMRNMFMFDKNDDEAKEAFRQLIYKCLDAWSQTVNDLIHDFVHYK
ncbi:hypothetical protein ENUP19_0121G0064 [Entamoeba nuttalli]|uniref:Phosphatidylinositol 3-kinase n=1 Tax=Entamoeba nuttalli TaxID=412467 RepID=A0ABQ0DIN1_9EUKA